MWYVRRTDAHGDGNACQAVRDPRREGPVTRAYDPTLPKTGRLARLGVLLDAGEDHGRIVQSARLCDRAGIEAIWLRVGATPIDPLVAADLVGMIRPSLTRARLGLHVDGAVLEVVPAGFDEVAVAAASRDRMPKPPFLRLGAIVDHLGDLGRALEDADDVVLVGWRTNDLEMMADEVRAECVESGRSASTLGVAVVVPTSIGRTAAEAEARAAMDAGFARFGDVPTSGIFGTLEECQDRVIALAHAGVTDIRCVLPAAADLHDVIAQLTAVTVGSTDVLRPGSLRSPAPPPPDGWGGRPDTPPKPGVSGGSRRR